MIPDHSGRFSCPPENHKREEKRKVPLYIRNLGKSYRQNPVFQHVSMELKDDHVYCLTAPSGAGKTTFLRILMGLELPDEGAIDGLHTCRAAPVFQEDRLCPHLNAAQNISLVNPVCSGPKLRQELLALLPADSLDKPVSSFSGGMRRRVSLLRALLSPGTLLLFDEPFNGLDEQSRQDAINYVRKRRNGRTLLFTTHHIDEARALNASCFTWDVNKLTWHSL